jgi:hypothetical protein
VRVIDGAALRGSEEAGDTVKEFARHAGLGLARLEHRDLAQGSLCLIFAASAWLRFSRIGVTASCSSLLSLRRTLLEASGLDRDSEPIPLLAGDHSTALIGLSHYTHGLIRRAARHSGRSPVEVVEEALQLL